MTCASRCLLSAVVNAAIFEVRDYRCVKTEVVPDCTVIGAGRRQSYPPVCRVDQQRAALFAANDIGLGASGPR
ncbi:hypothetical protein [Mycobacterium leprae]|uniref:hypothetical protein n=1 Tax=Mycobacterium leprae TaxID=1769 RepID=UPI0006740B6E|nr:hypothetical protein [Mycobacterium leprae]OAX70796.1 hypothetical protein A3216_09910 [Mycobacterium leprae 7935681]